MSKYVKNLIADELKQRFEGVEDAILVNVVGMDANATTRLRKTLREKDAHLLVVKRSLAKRATEGGRLQPLFEKKQGPVAVVWGCEDFVSLAKVVVEIVKSGEFPKLELKGGVMDGDLLTAEQVFEVSKWPNREEQIALLVGQILGPGANLVAQILGPGRTVAGQIKKLVEDKEGDA
ncbi:MAG: 50S ribosomal protein L10 [Pirellulaceae bacterium]|nr:MAG: 50S ribosomal protein L10 [Pirellulaceae bacterium]